MPSWGGRQHQRRALHRHSVVFAARPPPRPAAPLRATGGDDGELRAMKNAFAASRTTSQSRPGATSPTGSTSVWCRGLAALLAVVPAFLRASGDAPRRRPARPAPRGRAPPG